MDILQKTDQKLSKQLDQFMRLNVLHQVCSRSFSNFTSVVIATDGSYDLGNNRVEWGFEAYQDDVKLTEASDSNILHTSSIRMELEAIRHFCNYRYTT